MPKLTFSACTDYECRLNAILDYLEKLDNVIYTLCSSMKAAETSLNLAQSRLDYCVAGNPPFQWQLDFMQNDITAHLTSIDIIRAEVNICPF